MTDERVREAATKAAALLPEPPGPRDPFGYLAWEELVLSTARRLQQMAWPAVLSPAAHELAELRLRPSSSRLDADSLLVLGALLAHSEDTTACEELLSRAVAAGHH